MRPAQTSGGTPADWRITALTDPSRENEPPAPLVSEFAAATSSPVHSICGSPPWALTLTKPEFPSTFAAKRISSLDLHASEAADAFRFGVISRAGAPIGSFIETTTT